MAARFLLSYTEKTASFINCVSNTPLSAMSPWKSYTSPEGHTYYHNTQTDETSWVRPGEMDAQRAESGEETSTGKQECGSDTNAPVSTSRAADSAQDLSAVDKDLAPLKSFRKKIKYDKYNNDHLRFAKSQTSALGKEKVVFSDSFSGSVSGHLFSVFGRALDASEPQNQSYPKVKQWF